ncbi:MAG TPA: hypothetical protein VG815_14940 [Chloroflexota bacterium]|jgi:hypothetical protein|nr:hypothetical protein [Chloroflexota bacterium]
MNKRTTVLLPCNVDALLRFEAEVRGLHLSDVARAALEAFVARSLAMTNIVSIRETAAGYRASPGSPARVGGADRGHGRQPGVLTSADPMRLATIKLPEGLDARVRAEAKRLGLTFSEFTREALGEYLGIGRRRTLKSAASGRSGHTDTARRAEDLLFEAVRFGS